MEKKLLKWIILTTMIMAAFLSGCAPKPSASADIVTTASIVNNDSALATALSNKGTWIIAILNDISTNKDLVIEGDFHDKNDTSLPLYRTTWRH